MKKQNFKSRNFKGGSYSALITAFVLAIIIVVNLVVTALPSTVKQFDFSEQKLFTISEQTKKILKKLDSKVNIYLIAQAGKEESVLLEMLDKYKALSSKVKVNVIDPAVNPSFVGQYTSDSLADNSLIVTAGSRSRVIAYANLYETIATGSVQGQTSSKTQFKGEDMLTSAIDFVLSENLPKMYVVSGHGESSLDSAFQNQLERENIQIESLTLTTAKTIPADAACLFMQAPTGDLNENEVAVLSQYLKNGGKLFYTSFYDKKETPNLDGLLADYGISVDEGFVCEGNSNNYIENYNAYIVPVYGEHEITDPLAKHSKSMVIPLGQNIRRTADKRDSVKVTTLLKTTTAGYKKSMSAVESKTIAKSETDESGIMTLSALIEDSQNGKTTKIIVATTPYLFNSDMNTNVSGGNYDFLLNAVSYLCEHDSMISIRGKDVASASLVVASGQSIAWMIGLMLVVPIICIVTGLVIWQRRRKF